MKDVIVTANQKGGVGKSTTAHQIAAYLSMKGFKTLLVDLDGQANISLALNAKNKGYLTTYEVLDAEHKAPIEKAVLSITDDLYLIPASNSLYNTVLPRVGRFSVLKKTLASIENSFDYIVIDTPPNLGDMQLNALVAATKVIVPVQADLYSLDAITDLAETINAIREESNPGLKVVGVLLTRYQGRSVLTKEITELIEKTSAILQTKTFKSKIRENVSIKESVVNHTDIFSYDMNCNGAKDYKAFCEELMKEL